MTAKHSRSFTSLVLAVALLLAAIASFGPAPASASEPEHHPCVVECEIEIPSGPPEMLVIDVGWDTGNFRTSAPVVPGESKAYADYISGPVNEWLAAAGPGHIQPFQVTAAGEYTIAPPHFPDISNPKTCDSENNWFSEIVQRAKAAATANGFNLNRYNTIAVTWGAAICNVFGITEGNVIGLSRMANTPVHELGHRFGIHVHAGAIRCTENGAYVSLSNNCKTEETGDVFDTMGQGNGAFNAIFANQLGWLTDEEFCALWASDSTTTVALKPYSRLPHEPLRAIRLQDGSTTLWIEYRTAVGLDSNLGLERTPGLLIHREVVNNGNREAQLLDMTPSNQFFGDAALPVGQTWANPLGTMKITLNSANASGATVTISPQRVTVPDVRGDSMPEAESALAAVGLKLGLASYVPEAACNYIERIASTNPGAGTHVFPGTVVLPTIGQVDPKHPCL
jgi:PASTA domain